MRLKQLLRPLLLGGTLAATSLTAQAQQEHKVYADGSLNSLGIGSAFSYNLWSSSYVGFNLSKTGYWTSTWKTGTDGGNNGAAGIIGGIGGGLSFLTIPTANPSAGGQNFADAAMPGLVKMTLHPDGRLQIGNKFSATHTDAKLSVYGKITASSLYILADNPTNWADYVFANDYSLTPLPELEAYVRKNHHLPEIPTTAEVAAKGVNLGEMNVLLLKKVEELTLHLIEMDKKLNALSAQSSVTK